MARVSVSVDMHFVTVSDAVPLLAAMSPMAPVYFPVMVSG